APPSCTTKRPAAMADGRQRLEPAAAPPPARDALPPGPQCLESLWLRLKVGGRVRPRDALLLRRLALAPFDASAVYEVDGRGYVVAVGLPGERQRIDAATLLRAFESRFGIPESFSNVVPFNAR